MSEPEEVKLDKRKGASVERSLKRTKKRGGSKTAEADAFLKRGRGKIPGRAT